MEVNLQIGIAFTFVDFAYAVFVIAETFNIVVYTACMGDYVHTFICENIGHFMLELILVLLTFTLIGSYVITYRHAFIARPSWKM